MARRRSGGKFVFGLMVVGLIVAFFSDDKSSTSAGKLNTPPSIPQHADTAVVDGSDGSGRREVLVPGAQVTTPGHGDVKPKELLASVKSSLEAEKPGRTISTTPSAIVYSSAKLRMREGPGTSFQTVTTLEKGTRLEVSATDGEWFRVSASLKSGWVHRGFVSDSPVSVKRPTTRQEPAPARRLVKSAPESRSGQPVRDAYVGSCDCPYDLMSNGRRCGGRSAYSRPGGRSPQCYF